MSKPGDSSAFAFVKPFYEVLDEKGKILPSLSQGRDIDGDYIDPIVEVFPKFVSHPTNRISTPVTKDRRANTDGNLLVLFGDDIFLHVNDMLSGFYRFLDRAVVDARATAKYLTAVLANGLLLGKPSDFGRRPIKRGNSESVIHGKNAIRDAI